MKCTNPYISPEWGEWTVVGKSGTPLLIGVCKLDAKWEVDNGISKWAMRSVDIAKQGGGEIYDPHAVRPYWFIEEE